jgi:hypothetical protein
MSFTKTNLEILDIEKLADLQTNYIKSEKPLSINDKIENIHIEKEFILKINIIDASTLTPSLLSSKNISPKFKYLYAHDDYHFGTVEHFINNCNLKNLNKITTIENDSDDEWKDLHQFDIIVSSKEEDIEFIKTSIQKLNSGLENRFYLKLSMDSELKEEGILVQLQKHISPKIDKSFLVNILESMGVCAKIDFIHRENKRFLAKTEDVFFEKVQMSLKNLDDDEKIDIEEYFQKTYNFKRNTSFIKSVVLSWIIKK